MGERDDRSGISRTPLVLLLIVAIAGSVGLALLALQSSDDEGAPVVPARQGPFRGNPLPKGLAGKRAFNFSLPDAAGGTTRTADLAGKPYLVTFLYTDCPDVCPLIADEIRQALQLLRRRAADVAVLAVSVDPAGDTPDAVGRFRARHHLPENFHYLIGSEKQLKPVWDAYFAAPQIPGRADSSHTASVWVIDARGRIRTKFSGGAPIAPRDIAHDLRVLVRERDRQRASVDAPSA